MQRPTHIGRLLHQFAAGFLKEPNPSVRERLEAVLRIEVSSGAAPLEAMAQSPTRWSWIGDLAMQDEVADLPTEPSGQTSEPADDQPDAAGQDLEAGFEHDRAIDEAIARAVAAVDDLDDDIDVLDMVDPDLFPIFEEEAPRCCSTLNAALREWGAHPQQPQPRGGPVAGVAHLERQCPPGRGHALG